MFNTMLPSDIPEIPQSSRNYMLKFRKLQVFAIYIYDLSYIFPFKNLYQKTYVIDRIFSCTQFFEAPLLISEEMAFFSKPEYYYGVIWL